MSVCALIPAAGRARRLAVDTPKILVPIVDGQTIWTILRDLLTPFVDHIHVVLSPWAQAPFDEASLKQKNQRNTTTVTTSIQVNPIGMGDAIFGAYEHWHKFDTLLVIWGDQVNLSEQTVKNVVASAVSGEQLVLPLATMAQPYVQYVFDNGILRDVRQTREGALTDPIGDSDVGLFAFSVKGLREQWQKYLASSSVGAATGEVNFLPFFPYLSSEANWAVKVLHVEDCSEARGVNTPEDLEFARGRFRKS